MLKEDFSHLLKEPEAPKLIPFGATFKINVLSTDINQSEETMQMLLEFIDKFQDIEIVKATWDE